MTSNEFPVLRQCKTLAAIMKFIILISAFFILNTNAFSQKDWSLTSLNYRIYKELSKYNVVESQRLGFQGYEKSERWAKADSFFYGMDTKLLLIYSKDSSHSIKYYSFLKLLPLNDKLALGILKQNIFDSTLINFYFDDEMGEEHFNQLLASEYKIFIQLKYCTGGKVTVADRHYLGGLIYFFPKTTDKIWKKKYEEYHQLISSYGLKDK